MDDFIWRAVLGGLGVAVDRTAVHRLRGEPLGRGLMMDDGAQVVGLLAAEAQCLRAVAGLVLGVLRPLGHSQV